jgi:hypothetical protein
MIRVRDRLRLRSGEAASGPCDTFPPNLEQNPKTPPRRGKRMPQIPGPG